MPYIKARPKNSVTGRDKSKQTADQLTAIPRSTSLKGPLSFPRKLSWTSRRNVATGSTFWAAQTQVNHL